VSDLDAPTRERVADWAGARSVVQVQPVQEVWSGYGHVLRCVLDDGRRVVVKEVRPPDASGRSHRRKLHSYQVEATFYRDWARQCDASCPVAACHRVGLTEHGWLFVLEDLDARGLTVRTRQPTAQQRRAALTWLAGFHARFLDRSPDGLWPTGTYWHLQTRPDELATMADGPLKQHAHDLDAALTGARFQTLVHGDAKPANFCFHPTDPVVAAVDFQYVGGGPGCKDVVYLLGDVDRSELQAGLEHYFEALEQALVAQAHPDKIIAPLLAEWRDLLPLAWADYARFLAGWAPGQTWHRDQPHWVEQALARLG